jgi:hypothetical protein
LILLAVRNLIAPLLLLTYAVCGTAIAFPTTQLEINWHTVKYSTRQHGVF